MLCLQTQHLITALKLICRQGEQCCNHHSCDTSVPRPLCCCNPLILAASKIKILCHRLMMAKSVQDEAIIFHMMQQGPFPGLKPKQILLLINHLHLTLHMQAPVHKDLLTQEDPWLNSTQRAIYSANTSESSPRGFLFKGSVIFFEIASSGLHTMLGRKQDALRGTSGSPASIPVCEFNGSELTQGLNSAL